MKTSLILFLSLLANLNIYSQIKIKGKVLNTESIPLEYAEVILINKDSIAIKSELTNERGEFLLEAKRGWYKLQMRQINKILYSKTFDLITDLDLGIITVNNVSELETVTVVGKKKLIERKIDRLVFNVEKSIAATGGDALDALKITPGVKVQNDNVSIIGKGSVSVMVDDKLIQLNQGDLSSFLQSISADNIKSIEVITTPPAKYDAIGNSGIINIKTKTAKSDSWNANVGTSYLQRSKSEGSVFGNFNYNKNKLTISSSFNYRKGARYSTQDDYAYFPDGLWYTASPYTVEYKRFGGKFGLDYKINKNWTAGIQYMLNTNSAYFYGPVYTPVTNYNTNEITRYLRTNKEVINKPIFNSINYYNDFKLDTLGKKITVNLDYFNFENKDDKLYDGISIINIPFSQQYFVGNNKNIQKIDNISGKIDIEYPTSFADLSFGGKVTSSKSKNTIQFFNSGLVNNPVTVLPLDNNIFEYTENIQALYVSGNKKFNEKWETQFGIRMEATQTNGNSLTLNQVNKNDYTKLFPTLYINYKPNENNSFAFNYSRRIERPTFNDLNPNLYFENPFQSIEGNPFLQPAFIDNLEFIFTHKNFESKIYFSNEQNLYGQVAIADPATNLIRFTNENYANTKRFGFSENYSFDKVEWWTSNNAIDLNYAKSTSFLNVFQREQEGLSGRLSTNNDFVFNKDETYLFNINYWYNIAGVDGKFYNIGAMSNFSASIQYLLLNKDLRITLRGNDIFRQEKIRVNSTVNNVYQEGHYYNDNQSVQLTVSYKFGNQKIKALRRSTGNEEERNRTGN